MTKKLKEKTWRPRRKGNARDKQLRKLLAQKSSEALSLAQQWVKKGDWVWAQSHSETAAILIRALRVVSS